MITVISKKTFQVGSVKNGYMHIAMNEEVSVVKETANQYYIKKDGLTKAFPKTEFELK